MGDFENVVVKKPWGYERLIFQNDLVACWLLRIERDQRTSLHCHPTKYTAVVLLNGVALLQEGLNHSRVIAAPEKTQFAEGFFHRHTAIADCDVLEIETPVNKLDLYRWQDEYDRAGHPYETLEHYRPVGPDDPQFGPHGLMVVGKAKLRIVEFIDSKAFRRWVEKLPYGSIVVHLRGALRSEHGYRMVKPGQSNWSQNLLNLLEQLEPDERMQVMFVDRESEGTV